jgi:acyl-CoA reductase-like NAD-dependent aldehyde dehydrogenase
MGMPLEIINPYDQSLVCRVQNDEGERLEKKIAGAHAAFQYWRQVPIGERIVQVQAGLKRFQQNSAVIARDVTRQMGKPIVQAQREVDTVFERAEYMISIAEESLTPDILPELEGFERRIEHVPHGVVLNVAAWNYPLLIPINVVVPALLAGNTVLLKHSAKTPLSGQAFAEAFGDLEVTGLVTSLVLSHETTAAVIADPRVAHVSFTGSVTGGSAVYQQAAKRFIDVGLELGGKDPAYVAEDADVKFAVANTVDGACYNAGQSCCAVERVYVHRHHLEEYLDRAQQVIEAYRTGDPLEEATTLGPLVSRLALEEVERQVSDAIDRGARLLTGGRRVPGHRGNVFPGTLISNVPNEASVMQDESFGPIVPVRGVENDEEALRCMRETRFGLTASIWTTDRNRAERFGRLLESGTIFQNRCDYLDPALPWTGYGDSGKGSTMSRYGFYHLTRRKSIHFKTKI